MTWRGPFADRRPNELEVRIAAQRERDLAVEQRCRDDEAVRVKRGERPHPERCVKKGRKTDGA